MIASDRQAGPHKPGKPSIGFFIGIFLFLDQKLEYRLSKSRWQRYRGRSTVTMWFHMGWVYESWRALPTQANTGLVWGTLGCT